MTATRTPSPYYSAAALVVAALISLLPGPAAAQTWGSGKITGYGVSKTETRIVSGFHDVVLGVHAKLRLRQGDSEGLSITGDDNIVPLVETVVEDGTLKIRWINKRSQSINYKDLEVVVNARNIDGLTIAGSGRILAEKLKAATLRAEIDGSGAISFDALDADSVIATIRGNGHLSAAGRADALEITVAGSGQISAAKLETRRTKIAVMGSGQAAVWAKEELNATIAGSGEINYRGKPHLSQTVAGSGSIRQASEAS
jgi:Putative auto-transporter adhesin, head GIN domain